MNCNKRAAVDDFSSISCHNQDDDLVKWADCVLDMNTANDQPLSAPIVFHLSSGFSSGWEPSKMFGVCVCVCVCVFLSW